jgi:hypothetical protein
VASSAKFRQSLRGRIEVKKISSVTLGIALAMNALTFIQPAQAAGTYKITLTVIDEDAAKNVALYDDDGDQSVKHGLRKCADSKVLWLKSGASSTSDLIHYQKIGNKTQVKILNDSGKVVGLGTLSKVGWVKDRAEDGGEDIGNVVYGTCTYSQVITVKASDFYSISLPNANVEISPYDISLSDIKKKKFKLTLTL